MDNSKEFQLMLDRAIKSESLGFKNFDRTKNVQDQLQEIRGMGEDPLWFDTLLQFNNFAHSVMTNELDCGIFEVISPSPFTSMEQLWLGFVMRERYQKIWDGEKWVGSK